MGALLKTLVSKCHLVNGELRVEPRQPFALLRETVASHERLVAGEAASDAKLANRLPFLNTYRTMCLAPASDFQRLLDAIQGFAKAF